VILTAAFLLPVTQASATGAEPTIVSESATNVAEHDVTLEAQIDPNGLETTYEFWIESANCQPGPCDSISVDSVGHGDIAAGSTDQRVSIELDDRRLTLLTTFGARWLTRNRGFREVIEPVEAAVLGEVARRRALPKDENGEGILALLEQAHDENGSPMTQQELRDELITLLSDGPTATSLAWVFERLLRHPDKLDRLREDIYPQPRGIPTPSASSIRAGKSSPREGRPLSRFYNRPDLSRG
jgi:hypothetical protein